MIDMKSFLGEIWPQVVGSFILLGILALWAILRKKINKKFLFYRPIKRKAKKCLIELKRSKREHIVSKHLMYLVAKQTGIHLFGPEGEEVTLQEFAEILHGSVESLTGILKEIYAIELTAPSIWYHKTGESPEDKEFTQIVRKYLDLQKAFKDKKKEAIVKRFIVMSSQELNSDPHKDEFIKEHQEHGLELYLCPIENVGKKVMDTTIFYDEKGAGWAIMSSNLNTQTTRSNWVNVQIVDQQDQLHNFFRSLIKKMESNSTKLT